MVSISGSIAALCSELLDTPIRYTGLVLASEVSGAAIGGFAPLFYEPLVLSSGGKSWPVSIYVIVTDDDRRRAHRRGLSTDRSRSQYCSNLSILSAGVQGFVGRLFGLYAVCSLHLDATFGRLTGGALSY